MVDRWILHLVNEWHGNGILLYILITTVIAGGLSSLIGLERQLQGEAAGVRTHALIAIASSLLMTISIWAIRMADGSIDIIMGTINRDLNYDTSRIAAASVTGIGFLGGGVIIREKFTVRGLATAATLWICTAIGLACGAGFVLGAAITTGVVLVVLIAFNGVLHLIDRRCPNVTVSAQAGFPVAERIRAICEENGLALKSVHILQCTDGKAQVSARFQPHADPAELDYLCELLLRLPEVHGAAKEAETAVRHA